MTWPFGFLFAVLCICPLLNLASHLHIAQIIQFLVKTNHLFQNMDPKRVFQWNSSFDEAALFQNTQICKYDKSAESKFTQINLHKYVNTSRIIRQVYTESKSNYVHCLHTIRWWKTAKAAGIVYFLIIGWIQTSNTSGFQWIVLIITFGYCSGI